MTTIYDVAKKAGVSPKTVSRVLNGDAPVGKKTRETVESAMAELGYVPSSAARMMRSNKSGLVGLITGAISGTASPVEPSGLPDLYIVQGIQSVISASDKTLMIADTTGEAGRVAPLINTFLEHRVEALIYVADHHEKIELPIATTQPLVLVNCHNDGAAHAVVPDDVRGQFDLVSRLVDAGHRRIAYLTLQGNQIATTLRTKGYKSALKANDIDFDPELVVVATTTRQDASVQLLWDAIDGLLSLNDPPTVLCCGNDEMALRVYDILRSRGINIPEQISVAGYDNYTAIAETLNPPLTTVELPYWAMGVKAANLLLDLIAGKTIDRKTPMVVGGPVRWRSSVATSHLNVSQINKSRREIQ